MPTVKVTFEDGRSLTTDINGTREEILAYYFGQEAQFNFGDTDEHPADDLRRAVAVQFLDPLDPMADVLLRVECDKNNRKQYAEPSRCPVAIAINRIVRQDLQTLVGTDVFSLYPKKREIDSSTQEFEGPLPDHYDEVVACKDFTLAVRMPAKYLIGA